MHTYMQNATIEVRSTSCQTPLSYAHTHTYTHMHTCMKNTTLTVRRKYLLHAQREAAPIHTHTHTHTHTHMHTCMKNTTIAVRRKYLRSYPTFYRVCGPHHWSKHMILVDPQPPDLVTPHSNPPQHNFRCMYACMYSCIHVRTCVCMFVCMCVCVYIMTLEGEGLELHVPVCMHVCMCVCAHRP